MGKFDNLKTYFEQQKKKKIQTLKMSFTDIEKINGSKLEDSAHNYDPYWANDKTHSIAKAWMNVGYKMVKIDRNQKYVTFELATPAAIKNNETDFKHELQNILIEMESIIDKVKKIIVKIN